MKFRTRIVAAFSATVLGTFGVGFVGINTIIQRSELRELDEAVHEAVSDELHELERSPHLSDINGPTGDDSAPLERYAVLFRDNVEIERGKGMDCAPPPHIERKGTFTYRCGTINVRGLFTPVPSRPGLRLYLGLPRTNLDNDNKTLRETLAVVLLLSLLTTSFVAFVVVRRLTQQHEAIAVAARRVASGDLHARAAVMSKDSDVEQLTKDVNLMIERLAALVESRERFIAHAAHELRSPLTALYGELSLAARRERSNAEYKETVDEALDASRRLKALAEDLLSLARSGTSKALPKDPVPLLDVFTEALSPLQETLARKRIDMPLPDQAFVAQGRRSELVRLFRNLFENALRHSPEGGTIFVQAQLGPAPTELTVSVEDAGEGVPQEEQERIFEPFYRGAQHRADAQSGTGLGLAIALEIAKSHAGELRLDPHSERGARFIVTLPRGEAT